MRQPLRGAAAALMLWTAAPAVLASDGDQRVLTDEITERGDVGIDLQTGFQTHARNIDADVPTAQVALIEVSYGIADDWEASLQLPLSRVNSRSYVGGLNLEFQYVAPHPAESDGPYYGIRIELGYAGGPAEQRTWQTEWRPILGYHSGPWHGVINAGITAPVTGPDTRVTFEPTLRLVRSVSRRSAAGFEFSSEAGPISHLLAGSQRNETLMAVFDTRVHKIDITFGLGKGLNANSPGIVGKLLAEFELDD